MAKRSNNAFRKNDLSMAYRKGVEYFQSGRDFSECPYPKGVVAYRRWIDGYLAARTNERLKSVFEKRPELAFPI